MLAISYWKSDVSLGNSLGFEIKLSDKSYI